MDFCVLLSAYKRAPHPQKQPHTQNDGHGVIYIYKYVCAMRAFEHTKICLLDDDNSYDFFF